VFFFIPANNSLITMSLLLKYKHFFFLSGVQLHHTIFIKHSYHQRSFSSSYEYFLYHFVQQAILYFKCWRVWVYHITQNSQNKSDTFLLTNSSHNCMTKRFSF